MRDLAEKGGAHSFSKPPRLRPRPLLIYLVFVLYQASFYLSHNLPNSFSRRSPIAMVLPDVYIAIGVFEFTLISCPLLLCCQGIKQILDRGGGLLDKETASCSTWILETLMHEDG